MNSKLHELITRARLRSGKPNSAPAVVSTLLTGDLRDELALNAEAYKAVLTAGLNQVVRAALKNIQGENATETAKLRIEQLDLWPEDCRALIKLINQEGVYVPSRGDFVELVPDALTKKETTEAGQYLISKGRQCIQRGELLLRLAALRKDAAA